jgi:hypothetical protein
MSENVFRDFYLHPRLVVINIFHRKIFLHKIEILLKLFFFSITNKQT